MKTLSILFAAFSLLLLSTPSFAAGDMMHGFDLGIGLFANQNSTNTGTPATTTTTTEMDGHLDLGYDFGTLYLGATYFYNSIAVASTTTTTTTNTWYGPTVAVNLGHFRIGGSYILGGTQTVSPATAVTFGGGTGINVTIEYNIMITPKIYFAPMIDYYSMTMTPSPAAGNKNLTFGQLAPFVKFGFML